VISKRSIIAVGLGEVLFDDYGSRKTLGGAPANFAVHCAALLAPLGGRSAVVSRVGDDSLGGEIRASLLERGVECSGLSVDPELPTGRVVVSLRDGEPSYEILRPAAWDRLELSEAASDLAATASAVCFGTLAQRSRESRDAILEFLSIASGAVRMLDLNLRGAVERESVEQSLLHATAVKLNEEEAEIVGGLLGFGGESETVASTLCSRFELDFAAITRGPRGTLLLSGPNRYECAVPALNAEPGSDRVGAGDACAAGLVCSLLAGRGYEQSVGFANRIGAFVAGQPGATPILPQELIDQMSSIPVADLEPKSPAIWPASA